MLESVFEVDWSTVTDAYGTAEDLPGLLMGLLSEGPEGREERERSLRALHSRVCHQGSRCDASSYVVRCLCEVVDVATESAARVEALELASRLALGEADDAALPFDEASQFARVAGVDAVELGRRYRRALEDDELGGDLLKVAPLVWEREAYRAMKRHTDALLRWTRDGHVAVSMRALAMTPWFPDVAQEAMRAALEIVQQNDAVEARTTALITLGLLARPEAMPGLSACLTASAPIPVRVGAAVAMALISPRAITDEALETLLEADAWRAPLDSMSRSLPFARSLTGYVARALHRIEGLAPTGRSPRRSGGAPPRA